MTLRETLRAMADEAPPPVVPAGLFDRARRRHRRRQRWAAGIAAVLVLVTGYALSPVSLLPAQTAAGPAGLPSQVYAPPNWIEHFTDSPNGPASLVFTSSALPLPAFGGASVPQTPTAIVGLARDTYRVLYSTQGALTLSPDGRTVLVAQQTGTDMAAKNWRTDAVDLVSGTSRTLITGAEPVSWSTDGRHVVVVQPNRWDHPDAGPDAINDDTVSVLSWPSGRVEWSVHVSRPDTVEGESTFLFALSPDGTKIAVSTSRHLRVYRSDGTVAWDRTVGWTEVAGPAAWRDDTHLAVFVRDLGSSEPFYDASHWTLSYVDPGSGEPVAAQGYPVLGGAFDVSVVAWRADTAYAVTRSQVNARTGQLRSGLVRLAPDAATAPQVISVRTDANGLGIATDYVDRVRPAGSPAYGVDWLQVLGTVLDALTYVFLGGLVLTLLWAWWRHRRYRRLRSIPPAP